MFRLMNQGIAKSEYEARKDAVTSDESPIVQYKSQAADGCQQCQKLENAFIETQKKLERTQRQLTKANDYNEDLRKQIHWLSAELHEIRSKSKNKSDVGTQVQLTSETNDYKSSLCLKEEKIKSEDNKQALGNHLKETAKPLHDEDGIGNSLSIAEELKQAAEEAVEETGYVYDEASGLYYDKNSGYYYNPETALHYDSNTGTYYTYDSVSGTYIFHSQVDTSYVQQSHEDTTSSHYPAYTVSGSYQGDTTSAHYPAYEVPDSYQGDTTTGSYEDYQETDAQNYGDSFQDYRDPSNTTFTPSKKNKKRKKKAKKAQDLAENQADSTIDSVTNALQNIQVKDPYSFPPCVRLIVTDSDHLDFGSLFIITCDGGTIGREKYLGNVIIIPDINISKIHAQLKYMADTGRYYVMDYGSQNGTFLNEERISESKCSSTFLPVNHGDSLQIGCTRFLLHIHPGSETCDECEPGQVKAAFQAQQTKDIQILSKEEKKKQARQELNQIKKKYGLKNTAYIDNNEVIKNPNYQDRAEERRKTKGSDNPYQVDEAPSSVHRPITENNVGHKLLKKMGWSEGESLGKDNSGIQDPVCVSFRMNQKAGLGSEAVCSSSLDDVGEGNKSKRWLEAQQRYRKAIAEKQIPTPAWVKESKLKPSDFL